MCGRYVTITKIKEIEKRYRAETTHPELYQPSTNVSAGHHAPVITNENPREIKFFQFGFTPSWAKKNMYVINARSEGDLNPSDDPNYCGGKGIISKPMFRSSIRHKRCLIIADAFIEGPKQEKLSRPYCVYMRKGERPFSMAGIWDRWLNPESGEIVESFAIITAPANELMQKIGHHRSPVIVPQEKEQEWLCSTLELQEVTSFLSPYPAENLNAYPIGPAIKNPRENGLHLLKPLGDRVFKEYDYQIYEEIQLFGMGDSPARFRSVRNK
jgi:putative SOS response-associated peptidase YedK